MAPQGYRWQSRVWRPRRKQARILDLVARGLTNRQIAAEVGMTLDGVKWHVSQALAETGLADRAALGRWWLDSGSGAADPAWSARRGPYWGYDPDAGAVKD